MSKMTAGVSTETLSGIAIQLGLYGLLTVVAIVAGALIPGLGFWGAAIATTAALVLVLGTAAVVSITKNKQIDSSMEQLRHEITLLIETFRADASSQIASWLYTERGLVAFESKVNATEIIVATADLVHDEPGGLFATTVRKNIARGVRYTYLIPDTFAVKARTETILRSFPDSERRPEFILIPREGLDGLTSTNLVAFVIENEPDVVCLELPVDPDPKQRYWARLHKDYACTVIGRLHQLIEQNRRRAPARPTVDAI